LQNQIEFFDEQFQENKYDKAKCGILCKKDGSIHIEGIYADEGITGTSLKKREAYKQMIRDAKKGLFNMIITKSVARFGRSVEDLTKTLKDLKEIGVGVYFLDIQANSLENNREFMINLFASLAQEESNNKSFIIQFGVLKAMQNGKWVAATPYGYTRTDGILSICPTESEIVKKIYHLFYNEQWGYMRIADYLNDLNIPTKKKGAWHPPTISRILSNPIYTGIQIQHKTKNLDVNRYISAEVPEDEWIKHEYEHLRIVEQDLFDLVQKEKDRRLNEFGNFTTNTIAQLKEDGEREEIKVVTLQRKEKRHSSKHLFSNLGYCGNCGSILKRKKRKVRGVEIYEWVCASNDYKGSTRGCEYRNSFIEGDLLEIVKEKIKNFREDEEMLQYILNAKLSMIGNLNDITAIEEVENSIQKLMNDRESNFELFSAKIITIDEYKSRNDKIQKQLDDLNEKKTLFGHIGKEEEYIRLKLDKDFKELKEINLDNLSNAILRKVVERIEVATVDKETEQVKDVSIDFIINGASMDELMVSLFGIKTKISS
jgi:DNA invertase Pin-like site-specific DNA recombinase